MSVEARSRPNTHADPRGRRLESWKEIAGYLGRDVTTARRWEKQERLPVYRLQHNKLGSIYAYTSELDAWRDKQALAGATDAPAAGADHQPMRIWRAHRGLLVGGVVLVGLLAAAYLTTRSRAVNATRPKIQSLAVLRLKNLSGDPTQEYLADGMTEALIGRLSHIRALRVISRTSVMRFKDTQLSVPEIAKTLQVDALVEGSVTREGNRIRVRAQLIRASTEEPFWSETYDWELQDVLALQSEVAQAIAGKVEVTVTGAERARLVAARQVSPEVYESYLKGAFREGYSRIAVEQSIAYFEEAIRRDPTFAPAYLGLAGAYDQLGTPGIGGSPPSMVRPKVISAIRKAMELDPALPEAHAMLAGVYQEQWQWSDAEDEYKQALELSPNDAGVHLAFSGWLVCQGRTEEAAAWSRRARELDPFGVTGGAVGWIQFQSRHYEEAIRELQSALAVHPNNASIYWFLGIALIANGQSHEAIQVLEKGVVLSERSPGIIGVLVRAYARAGRRTEALHLVDELKRRQRKGYIPAAAFVNAYLGLGENEQALSWLEHAYQEQSTMLQFLKVHPFFDPLRSDPRFKDLLHRVGLDKTY
jgi:TolB-like protein/Flp pilus assembly protein TadD